jgi:L-aspartate oxidase
VSPPAVCWMARWPPAAASACTCRAHLHVDAGLMATMTFNFMVIDSGVAGLRCTLEVSKHDSIAIITKAESHI